MTELWDSLPDRVLDEQECSARERSLLSLGQATLLRDEQEFQVNQPLSRVLEPEVMDTQDDARDYDEMDHREVNTKFIDDFLQYQPDLTSVVDLGTGPAHIPIELVQRWPDAKVLGIDLADSMLEVAERNVQAAGLAEQVGLCRDDAKALDLPSETFSAVISNSIVHHLPEPILVLQEAARIARGNAVLFVRDLMRPANRAELDALVQIYASGCNDHQRQLFADSLHAALNLQEIRQLVGKLGFDPKTVQQTSDRHWTWAARRTSS